MSGVSLGGREALVVGVAERVSGVVVEVDVLLGLGGVLADVVGDGIRGGGAVGAGVVGVTGG